MEILIEEDVDLVKVGNSEYYIYYYKRRLSDLKEVVVVLRRHIGTFFRESKKKLGSGGYQIRSVESIKRYLIVMIVTYVYFGLEVSENILKFSDGLKFARIQLEAVKITLTCKTS